MKLTATEMVTLDGVFQGPGGPDEDRRGGFDRGGWTAAYADQDMWPFLVSMFERADALLLGRKTWEIWLPYWPNHDDDPLGHAINALPKYVPSTTLKDPTWQHVILGRPRTGDPRTQGEARRRAPAPRQRRAAPLAARARPRRRAEPADLPGHRRRRHPPIPGAWPVARAGGDRLVVDLDGRAGRDLSTEGSRDLRECRLNLLEARTRRGRFHSTTIRDPIQGSSSGSRSSTRGRVRKSISWTVRPQAIEVFAVVLGAGLADPLRRRSRRVMQAE